MDLPGMQSESRNDVIELRFRTKKPNGLLFYVASTLGINNETTFYGSSCFYFMFTSDIKMNSRKNLCCSVNSSLSCPLNSDSFVSFLIIGYFDS